MKLSQSLTDRTINGGTGIFCQNTQVISYRKTLRSSSKVEVELVGDMKGAYAKYLQRLENPYTPTRKPKCKDIEFLGDFIDHNSGLAFICLVSNGYQLVCIRLHPMATASMNDDLISEIKYIYGKYMVDMMNNKAV